MNPTAPIRSGVVLDRLEVLRERRLAEDDRLVCLDRARLLDEARRRFGDLPCIPRQVAVLRHLCEGITPAVEPGDILLGQLPEVVPTREQERFVAANPELFSEPGLPGVLDSLSIFIPDWEWLVTRGIGGLVEGARDRLKTADGPSRREFLAAIVEALQALSLLIRRYATTARDIGLEEAADRCERVAWEPPAALIEALQLLAPVHMVLAYLVGGRDVTPGRLDQYLLSFYRCDLAQGRLDRDTATELLALFLLGLSFGAGNATDFDDNLRRSPCRYSHLYVTLGGCDESGKPADNELSVAILDAVRLLRYKEPTLCIRYREDLSADFRLKLAALIRDRFPVTVYHDDMVLRALASQGVPRDQALGYAHSACHNAIVVGSEAGSGPCFCNLPSLLLQTLECTDSSASFEAFFDAFTLRVRQTVEATRDALERQWGAQHSVACPLLQSALLPFCLDRAEPAWQAAPISHLNYQLMGLATTVDSLIALKSLVFDSGELTLGDVRQALAENWLGREGLRSRIRSRLPRYGQDGLASREMTALLGRMWVTEVERAAARMPRLTLWPGFYSHMVHVREGAHTPATPDGRHAGDPLSENLSPSAGTTGCTPTSVSGSMNALPFDHTPSGATTLTLPVGGLQGARGAELVDALLSSHFRGGGLQLQINVVDHAVLTDAMRTPERYPDLMVRVAGFSAYFTRLSPEVQRDVARRHLQVLE